MMIDRPAFNYDNSGNPIVPAEASVEHNALVKAIESSESDPDLRATWQREGGADQAITKVRAVEATIMAASPDAAALQSHITAVRHSIDSR